MTSSANGLPKNSSAASGHYYQKCMSKLQQRSTKKSIILRTPHSSTRTTSATSYYGAFRAWIPRKPGTPSDDWDTLRPFRNSLYDRGIIVGTSHLRTALADSMNFSCDFRFNIYNIGRYFAQSAINFSLTLTSSSVEHFFSMYRLCFNLPY